MCGRFIGARRCRSARPGASSRLGAGGSARGGGGAVARSCSRAIIDLGDLGADPDGLVLLGENLHKTPTHGGGKLGGYLVGGGFYQRLVPLFGVGLVLSPMS